MFEPEKLPAPDEMGFFFHPDIPGEDESDDVRTGCWTALVADRASGPCSRGNQYQDAGCDTPQERQEGDDQNPDRPVLWCRRIERSCSEERGHQRSYGHERRGALPQLVEHTRLLI